MVPGAAVDVGFVTGTPVLGFAVGLVLLSGAFVLEILALVGGCVGAPVDGVADVTSGFGVTVLFEFGEGTVVVDLGVTVLLAAAVVSLGVTVTLVFGGASVMFDLDVLVLLSSGVATVTVGIGFVVLLSLAVVVGVTVPGLDVTPSVLLTAVLEAIVVVTGCGVCFCVVVGVTLMLEPAAPWALDAGVLVFVPPSEDFAVDPGLTLVDFTVVLSDWLVLSLVVALVGDAGPLEGGKVVEDDPFF